MTIKFEGKTLEGYNFSTNYEKLFYLISLGYKILFGSYCEVDGENVVPIGWVNIAYKSEKLSEDELTQVILKEGHHFGEALAAYGSAKDDNKTRYWLGTTPYYDRGKFIEACEERKIVYIDVQQP